jgi:hypothetical protein
MMVLFGGRTIDQSALNDTWGLRRHRDGRWDWVLAPYKVPQPATAGTQGTTSMPLSRYQVILKYFFSFFQAFNFVFGTINACDGGKN